MTIGTAVLLPGLHGTGDLFAPFVDAAPRGINTVVVDYPIDELSIEVLERRARGKLSNHCIVIAESFSGPIGVRIAADARVRALVLCNSFISSPVFPSLRHLAIAPLFGIPLPKFLIRSVLLSRQASPILLENTHRAIRSIPASVIAGRIRQVLRTDEQTTVRALGKPILYLRGLSDCLVSENNWKHLQRIRPDAQIIRINGPHMLLQTSPNECWKAIVTFAQATAG